MPALAENSANFIALITSFFLITAPSFLVSLQPIIHKKAAPVHTYHGQGRIFKMGLEFKLILILVVNLRQERCKVSKLLDVVHKKSL